MRLAGTASWRFSEGIDQLPLAALYVRDAVGLSVPSVGEVPPRLDAELPNRSGVLDAGQRVAAAAEWVDWWSAVVADNVRRHRGAPDGVEQRAWLGQLASARTTLFDPPEFASLTDRPALRAAVRACFPEALRWADQSRETLLLPSRGRHGQFDYQLVRRVAEQTVHRLGVSPGAVAACAVVLPVTGFWWYRCAPGAVVCSVHAARDPVVAPAALTDAFDSGVSG